MTNYRYRVYSAVTGHEYADTDRHYTAECLALSLAEHQGIDHRDIAIDVIVSEPSDA